MKIQDALIDNQAYWIEQKKQIENQLAKHQGEVQRLANDLNEADNQIELYQKASQLLDQLLQDNNAGAAQIEVVKADQ